jgi:tetratricopeptide (TPR) repeat protein
MAIGISIQLLHPAVTSIQRYITPEIANQQKGGGDQIEGDQIAPPRPLHAASEIPLFRPSYLETRPRQKSAPPDQSGSQTIKLSTIFSTKTEEVLWVFGVFSLIVLFIVVEYDWLVRPLLRQRDAPVSAPPNSPWHETLGGILSDPGTQREAGKVLERLTFPWMLFHAWLPTLVARVNLGFDRLDHRSVIQAMLIALREGYHRQFIAMQSLRGLVFRFLGFMAVVILMSQASATWFHIPLLTSDKLLPSKDGPPRRNYCDLVLDPDNHVGEAARLLCSMNNGGLLFDIAYYEIIPLHYVAPFQGKSRVLEWLVDYNPALPHAANVAIAENYQQDIEIHDRSASATATNTDKNLQNENITAEEYNKRKEENAMMAMSFRVYHLGLLILFFTLGKMFLATLPIIPYGRNLAKIDQLLDSLSARRITKRGPMEWKPARWIFSALGSQTEQTLDHAPVDPRTIELAFLHILEDLQPEKHRWERRHIAALPTPEITFVFDELDKLGARAEPEGGILSNIREEFEQISHERRRSIALHNLLSDLKRVISSAPARFIFVGGRLLHDEWLADQTARSPLLTSIFDAQIHIPSFLTDRSPIPSADRWEKHKLHSRTRELLGRIHDNSWEFQHLWTAQRWRPFVGLVKFTSRPPAFIDTQPRSRNAPLPIRHLRVYEVATGRPLVFPWHRDNRPQYVLPGDKSQANVWEWQFQNELTYFLTYRSAGNPKKLRDLLSSLVRSSDQVFTDLGDRRWNNGDLVCQDVLYFPSNDILRVQFVAYIYRHLNDRLKEQVVFRDDKIAAAVFSITDFLFKFHGRAFSWHNIERIDELVHIHRAPDLREIMEDMVQHFSHRFLHTVLNGMYTFRFRSEVSKEIEYLSQHSEEEMAALNFTLDESQSLKLLYAMALKADQGRNKDLLNGLGELYEFDGDYDSARQHYKAALTLADDELKQLLGAAKGPVWQALSATDLGRQMVRRAIPWGVVRIRLMLQIGMTFEQAGHMERAEAEYHSATQLAWTIFSVYLEEDAAEAAVPNPFDEPALANHGNILKHMSLVYQPAMAVAWTSEKLIGDIDTSTTIVEKYIRDVRARLPFLTAKWNTRSFNKKLTLHSNFALIAADLHNKAGDLYFLKGRGPVQPMHLWAERAKGRTGNEFDGYLCKAYTHYATGLHELRRYISYRQETTGHKFNDSGRPSHTAEHWPSYVSLSAASASNDLAEAMLARVSLSRLPGEGKTFALLSADGHTPETPSEAANHAIYQDAWDFLRPFHRWMQEEQGDATDDPPPSDQKLHLRHRGKRWDLGHFEDWLGQWDNDDVTPVHHLGAAAQSNGDDTAPNIKRLLFSLNMSLVGGQCNEASGYLQDAAKEYVWVAESVSRLLWSGLMLEAILSNAECHDTIDPRLAKIYGGWLGTNGNWTNIIQYLVGMAVEALLRADKLYRRQHPHTKPITARLEKGKAKVIGEAPEVGDIIPAATFTTATSLLLVACRYEEAFTQPPSSGGEVLTPDIDRLARQLRIWTNRVPPDASATRLDRVRDAMDTLETILRYRRYPVLNLVNGLKTLVDAHVLVRIPLWAMDESSIPNEEKEKIIKSEREKAKIWLGDLRVVNNRYNAPFHFTPGQMAQTLFCWHFIEEREKLTTVRQGTYSEIQDSIGDHFFINDNLRELMRRIKQATEMVSMGRAYYDAISSLFYLYDDFNDRMIHFNHAQQMMNLEVISLIELLTEKQHGGGGALGLKRPLD